MAHGEKMDKILIFNKDDDQIPSGIRRGEDCLFCDNASAFNVIGQRVRSDFGGYVQRRTCQSAECVLKAIAVIKEETGL